MRNITSIFIAAITLFNLNSKTVVQESLTTGERSVEDSLTVEQMSTSMKDVYPIIEREARNFGVPLSEALALIEKESGGNCNARGDAYYKDGMKFFRSFGAAQINVAANRDRQTGLVMGYPENEIKENCETNIKAGIGYYAKHRKIFQSWGVGAHQKDLFYCGYRNGGKLRKVGNNFECPNKNLSFEQQFVQLERNYRS